MDTTDGLETARRHGMKSLSRSCKAYRQPTVLDPNPSTLQGVQEQDGRPGYLPSTLTLTLQAPAA